VAENGGGTRNFWINVIQTVGFPIVAAFILAWFAYSTIQWEREQLLPALRDNTDALKLVLEVLKERR
jgi:hypothetical protein